MLAPRAGGHYQEETSASPGMTWFAWGEQIARVRGASRDRKGGVVRDKIAIVTNLWKTLIPLTTSPYSEDEGDKGRNVRLHLWPTDMQRVHLAMPATSPWCQGPVPRPGGSQEPALHSVAVDGGGRQAIGNQRESKQHHRRSGVKERGRTLSCTCKRALRSICRLLLLINGDVEQNPGPLLRGAQWNAGGLTPPKRLA
ncbi:Tcoingi protein, partial [Trypanosoma conorhini]